MKFIDALYKAILPTNRALKKILRFICAAIMAALTAIVLWGVATRYVYGEQSKFSDELSRSLLICLTFLGGALAFAEKSHVGLTFIVQKFTPDAKICAKFAASCASFAFAILVLFVGGMFLIQNSVKSENELVTISVSMWQIYICVPLGGIFSAMFIAQEMLELVRGGKDLK